MENLSAYKNGQAKPISDEKRQEIKQLACFGLSDDEIGKVVKLSGATLRRRCREELDDGRAIAKSQVVQTLYKMATSGKCPAATIFWVKTRCGWKETTVVEEKPAPEKQIKSEKLSADPIEASKEYQRIMRSD